MRRNLHTGINAGSMADIAFLLLIFFLVTATVEVDSGMMRTLPPHAEKREVVKVKQRNILSITVGSGDEIRLQGGEPVEPEQLQARVKEFILNAANDPQMAEREIRQIGSLGGVAVSKAVVSLQSSRESSYDRYVQVQDALARAYRAVRDDYALRYFEKPFDQLRASEQAAIREAVPFRVSEAEPK